jgi:hypothetical protein
MSSSSSRLNITPSKKRVRNRLPTPPKLWFTFNGLHAVISQKTEFFLTTVMRTSDPKFIFILIVFEVGTLYCHFLFILFKLSLIRRVVRGSENLNKSCTLIIILLTSGRYLNQSLWAAELRVTTCLINLYRGINRVWVYWIIFLSGSLLFSYMRICDKVP